MNYTYNRHPTINLLSRENCMFQCERRPRLTAIGVAWSFRERDPYVGGNSHGSFFVNAPFCVCFVPFLSSRFSLPVEKTTTTKIL